MTIEAVMHTALGLLIAVFAGLLLLPAYKRRTQRLTTEALKRSMPLTEAEIRADKDRLRADYVLSIHKLESKLEKATLAHARQRVEINRRDAAISALEGELERMRSSLEEHENAHRVLEQTIMDRLPRVEARLAEARRLVLQRDREIAQLSQTAERQARALEEANQINTKGRDEILRLNAALATRSSRGRDGYADERQDSEVALRTELEALRAKTREQSSMIVRLQSLLARTGARVGLGEARAEGAGDLPALHDTDGRPLAVHNADQEIARLRSELAEAEATLRSMQTSANAGQESATRLAKKIVSLETAARDKDTELSQLRAELASYKASEIDDKGLRESKTAMRARIASLDAQAKDQGETIQRLRAEIAAANERTARQAAHFTEELRRLGAGTYQTSATSRRADTQETSRRRSLSDRLQETGTSPPRAGPTVGPANSRDLERATGFLRALGGFGETPEAAGNRQGAPASGEAPSAILEASAAELPAGSGDASGAPSSDGGHAADAKPSAKPQPRRGGLLERITRADGRD